MKSNQELYDFILNNIRKIIMAEEVIPIDASVSRLELLALLLVQRQQNITMSDLATGMVVPMSTATGIIDRLVKKGLLARGSHAEDRRVVTIALADDGKILVGKLNNHFNTLIDKVRNIVTEEEFEFILRMMQKVMFGLQTKQSESNTEPAELRRSIVIE